MPWIGETSSPGAPPAPFERSLRFGALRAAPAGPAPLGSAAPITFTSNLRPETSTA